MRDAFIVASAMLLGGVLGYVIGLFEGAGKGYRAGRAGKRSVRL